MVLQENRNVSSNGISKKGAFDVSGDQARFWLLNSGNPNALPNSVVVHPWANGAHITQRWGDMWIIDFGELREQDASCFEAPFRHVLKIGRAHV